MYTRKLRPQIQHTLPRLLILCLWLFAGQHLLGQNPSFSASGLIGENINNPTSLQFGPDDRLYVAQQDGLVFAYTIERQDIDQYVITSTETIDLVQKYVPNHDDDGTPNGTKQRQVTSLLVVGTAQNPVLYVASSDWRISVGVDSDLDTNSGVITRLTWVGNGLNDPSGYWDKVDIVRGLPRSEENHATNGMQIDIATNTLYVMQGGHTNKGAPSNNFAQTPEFALSAALLSVDLNAIEAMPILGNGFSKHIYDIPTLDDPTRGTPGQPDPGDPFGGNDGRNQARIVIGGPVQVYSPGFRNAYDVVFTENGRLYTFDNGPNGSWGGTAAACTNESSEANDSGYGDGLHFISGPGYYGGHPNYTRANPENSGLFIYEKVGGIWTQTAAYDWMTDFPDPPVPASMANPVECDYLIPAIENQALAIVNASTNGITEYRASNFNNVLKGNILAASFSGDIYSFKLNAAGDAVVEQKSLFSGFGSQPLDVTTQGDNDIFPGTVWAATYGSNSITVFEPNDFITCTGIYSTELDDDFDNYSNADEVDNGSDPCSAGSKPADRDLDYISDLNDPDDDNDGILDVVDNFAIDAENGLATFLPVHYDLFNYDPGEGFFGLGFTGLMQNGTTDYLEQFDESNLAAGGAAGLLTVESVPEGDAFKTKNTQEYAFQFGINVKTENGPFSIKVRMHGPFLGDTPGDSLSQGIYIGTGSQKDYLKFVLTTENGGGIEVSQEANDIATSGVSVIPNILSATYIDLILDIEPNSGMYITRYIIEGGNEITLGGGLLNNSIAYAVQSESQALAVGVIATSTGPAAPFSATWDRIDITSSGPTKTQIPDMEAAVGDASDQINLNNYFEDNAGVGNLTYSIIENTTAGIGTEITDSTLALIYPAIPDSGQITVRATDSDGYYVEQSFGVFLRTERTVLYRVNAGGGLRMALDDGIDWDADSVGNVSPYHDGNSNINGFDIAFFDASIPSTTPLNIFNSERWDPVATPEMNWEFPAEVSGIYEVRLYFANGFGGTSSPGQRVFDVLLEGDTLLNDYDIAADVGHLTGVCKTLLVPVTDGNLNIEFLHVTENPLVNAIEILGPASSETNLEASPNPLHFFSQQVFGSSAPQAVTLQNNGGRAITISGLEISGADSTMFTHSFGGLVTIQPGGSHNINVIFSPTSEGLKGALITIAHDADNDPIEIPLTGEAILSGQQVLFRVNAGGPQTAAADASAPDWSQDDANGVSPYLSGITNIYAVGDTISLHQTVPASAPMSMFQIERWGSDPSQPMQWDFSVPEGTPLEIRLYFAETFLTAQSNQNSPRVFDIEIDGVVPSIFDDLNIFEEVGHDVGIMKAFQTTSDGNIDIDFLHITNNPAIKGLEIIDLSTPVENLRPELLATDDQTNDEQDLVSLQIVAQDPDGDTLTYSATDLPPGLSIDSNTGLISGNIGDVAALGSPYETIIFVNDGSNPAVSDTIIWVVNSPGLPTDICINTGGTEYTDSEGKVFLTDDYFSSNTGFYSTNEAINNTDDDALFQTERYGIDFNYSIPLADGTYLVDLYFAEIYHGVGNNGGATSRVFSVDLEGVNALSNYDIFNTADIANGAPTGNGELYAVVETFQVTVSGGTLDIRLYKGAGGSDNAKISAICAYPTTPNNPPVVQNPGDQENIIGDNVRLMIGATDDEGDDLTYSAVNLPLGLSIDEETGLISGIVAEEAENNSPYSVVVSVSDGENTPETISFNWTIIGNNAPIVSNPGTQTNTEGDILSLAIVATDDEGDILTYGAINLPPGLSMNSTTGVISGTISDGADQNSPYSVIVLVSDGVNDIVLLSFAWIVNELNSPPVVDNPGDQNNTEGDEVTLNLVASDVDNDDLTFGATGLPQGLSINEDTGAITGIIANNTSDNSPYTVQVSVDDGVNPLVYISFEWVVNDNLPPLVATPNDQENTEGDVVSLSVLATDPEGDDLNFQASNLPTGLAIHPETGIISGTIDEGADLNSPYSVTVFVSDGINETVTVTFEWIVNELNSPPVVDNPGAQNNTEGDEVTLNLVASDVDNDDLTFGATGLPQGLSINENTGAIIGIIANNTSDNSPYTVQVSVDDGVNPLVYISFEWVVNDNLPPLVATPNDQENTEGDVVSLSVLATDPEGDDLNFQASNLPTGLAIHPETGIISGTIDEGADLNSPYSVTVFVSDGINETVTVTFEWIVNELNSPPVVDNPGDQNNTEGDEVSLNLVASDVDNDDLTFGATGLPQGLSINENTGAIIGIIANNTSDNSPYTVQVSVDDGVNPLVYISFDWVVNDNLPPLVATPNDQENTEEDVVSLSVLATDPEGDDLNFQANNLPAGLEINPETGVISGTIDDGADLNSPYSVTVFISDGINETVTVTFEWIVNELNTPPVVDNPGDQNNTEGDEVTLNLVASDVDNDELEFGATGLPQGLSINEDTGAITGTIANDASVNSPYTVQVSVDDGVNPLVYISFEWVVNDNLPPLVATPNDQESIEGDIVSLSVLAADPESDALNFQATNLPTGLGINPETGLISGTIADGAATNSPYSVSISVTDDINSPVIVNFTWTVDVPNEAPIVSNIEDQTNEEGEIISLFVSANDPEGDILSYTATGLPTGLNIDISTGEISGTVQVNASSNSPYQVVIFVSDGTNPTQSVSFTWYVNPPTIASAFMTINDGGWLGASTYGDNSFVITNTSNNQLKLAKLIIDISTSILPDLVFDPVGSAGDVVGKCFTADDGAVDVGVVVPTDACVDPFSSPRDGGYDVMSIDFTDFDPTESFGFSVDIDPTSIQGATGSGVAGSISGLELSGATIWAIFENGDTIKAETYYGGSEGSSQVCFEEPVSSAPSIEVLNLPASTIPRTAEVEDLNQTVRISGPVGADVGLLVVEAGLFLSEVNGNGFDIDPFEGNQALSVREFSATIGAGGIVDISIDLTNTTHPEWETGFNYLMAVIKDDEDCTSFTSDVWVLKVNENQPPLLSEIANQQNSEWETVSLALSASDPENDPLSYSAQNLPLGLSINESTGIISGTVAPGASQNSPYQVIVSVSDGTHTVDQSFTWVINVQPCIAPEILGFVLVNADQDIDVGTMMDGDTIRLQDLTYEFNVRAAACGFLADSVVMELSGDTLHKKTESYAPYALFGDFSGDFQPWPATPGEYTITATPYTNYNGQVYGGAPYSIDIVIVDAPNLPPTVYNVSTQFGYEWQNVGLNILASDPDEDPLTFRANNLPPGININPNNGQVRGRINPGAANGSPYQVTVGVNDGHNPEVTKTFFWVVGTQACAGPEVQSFTLLNATANTEMYQLADGDTLDLADFDHTLSVLANTCGLQPDEVVMALSGDTTHTRVEVNAPYTLFGGIFGNHEPWPVTPGTYTISATPYVSINGLWAQGEALSIDIVVINSTPTNYPPALDALEDQFNLEGDMISLQAVAGDIDGDILTFDANGLPAGLTIDPNSGLISGIIQVGTHLTSPYSVTVSVSDGEFEVFEYFTWTVDTLIPGCEAPKVLDFYLVNADTDMDMYPIEDGAIIDLDLISFGFNFRADLCGSTPDSLVITVVEDTLHYQVELSAPYSAYGDLNGDYYAWDASAGNYLMTATPYQNGLPVGEPKSINFTVVNGEVCVGNILLVVGSLNLSEGDQAAKDRLEELGFDVTVMHAEDAQTEDALDKSLVMISSTVFSVHVGNKFSNIPVPVMCWEAYLYDDLGLTGSQFNSDFQFENFQSYVKITNPTHPMAAGLSGTFPILDGYHTMPWGNPNANAAVIATLPGQPTQSILFGYETGVEMVTGIAPARRIGMFLHSNSTNYLNDNGWKLFDNALFWALDCENQDANLFPTVEITSPLDGTEYVSLDTLTITANAQDPDGSLSAVEFYINGEFIGVDPEFPYEISWTIPEFGEYTIKAIAVGGEGEISADSVSIEAIGAESCEGEVLLVVQNGPLGQGDLLVKQRLEEMGFTVQTIDDGSVQPFHSFGKDLVIISSTVASWKIGTRLKNIAVPVINYEAFLYDDMGMTGPVEAVDYHWAFNQMYLVINDASHPMAAGYSGFVWTYNTPETFIWGNPSASAVKVASIVGEPNKHAIFGYEAGSQMVGMTAPARRVGIFAQFSGVPYMTAAAWDLFESSVYWAIGCHESLWANAEPESRVSALESQGKEAVLHTKVYPNPSAGNTTLYVEHPASGPVDILISDMVGKVHYQTRIAKDSYSVEMKLPTQGLAKGTYSIQIIHPEFNKTERLIKLNGK